MAQAVPATHVAPSGGPLVLGRYLPARIAGAAAWAAFGAAGDVSAVPSPAPAGNWTERSTGGLVVWAHNFESDTEVTQHLLNGDPTSNAVTPRRVVDESGIGCLEQVILGAEIAVAYTAGSSTMVIDDAHLWPDPAVTGPFYVMACEKLPNVGRKNLFLCTARSGTTLTVSLYASPVSSVFVRDPVTFLQVAQSYDVGDYVGQESTSEWRRVFAALPAGENGKAVDDPGAGGTVPLRSRLTGNALSVPRDPSLWQYGWYGHPDNQALWDDWTPWQGASTLTPRGVSQGADPRYRLWDGSEFWIQFRTRIDPRFWEKHVLPDPSGTDSAWGRKFWALQSELSSTNQLVTGIAPSNRFAIPDTNPNPFSLTTYKAARVIGVSDWSRPGGTTSYQKGSPWDVAPHYANLSVSFKPSTGAPTPDGSAAWEHKDDEWVTWLIRVKPGRSGVAESEIEVKFARTEDPAYTGEYTTLLNVTDANIVYSGSGDYDYPAGSFSYPGVTTMNALPGFQAFGLMGYLNIGQTVGIPPSRASYYVRMAQVIFSKAPIAPPVSDVALPLPAWVPPPGDLAVLTNANGGFQNHFRDIVDTAKGYGAFWSRKIFNDFAGTVVAPNYGPRGAIIAFGGGHSATNDNMTAALMVEPAGLRFKRVVDPTNWFPANPAANNITSEISALIDPNWKDSLAEPGKPTGPHSYKLQGVLGPEFGGGPQGTFINGFAAAVAFAGYNSKCAHALPLLSPEAPSGGPGSPQWQRFSATADPVPGPSWGAPLLSAIVGPQMRMYLVPNGGGIPGAVRWLDLVTGQYVTGSGVGFGYDSGEGRPGDVAGTLVYIPERALLVCIYRLGGVLRFEPMDVSVAQPTVGAAATLSQSLPVAQEWSCAEWVPTCRGTGRIVLAGITGNADAFYEVEVPAVLTNMWNVERAPLPAGKTFVPVDVASNASNSFGKFGWHRSINAIVYVGFVAGESGDETGYVYTPRGA